MISSIVTASGEIPTGVLTITVDNSPEYCSSALVNGIGSCQLALHSSGIYTLTAIYGGNHILTSSEVTETHTVIKANTNTGISTSYPNPSHIGQAITVNFEVSSLFGIPTGSVNVSVTNNDAICTGSLNNGVGNCSLILSKKGIYTINAEYIGDSIFKPSSDTKMHEVELYKSFLPLTIKE
jgi:hypothetical protein